jgi:hypothetical protein
MARQSKEFRKECDEEVDDLVKHDVDLRCTSFPAAAARTLVARHHASGDALLAIRRSILARVLAAHVGFPDFPEIRYGLKQDFADMVYDFSKRSVDF